MNSENEKEKENENTEVVEFIDYTGPELHALALSLRKVGDKCDVGYRTVKRAISAVQGALNKRLKNEMTEVYSVKRWQGKDYGFKLPMYVTVEKVGFEVGDNAGINLSSNSRRVQNVPNITEVYANETEEERIERFQREDAENANHE